MFTKIPNNIFPDTKNVKILNIEEPLIDLKPYGFIISPEYFKQGINGSIEDCLVRESLIEMLIEARKKLPDGYNFKIFDAFRPYNVQKALWDKFYEEVKTNPINEGDSEELLFKKTSQFVSFPSRDFNNPFIHNTGGAIDLTIVNAEEIELDMGTKFDDFTEKSWTNYFEIENNFEEIRNNRRLLYNAMISSGFVNLPSEWWHFDYGDKVWGYYKNQDALYGGIKSFI